METGLTIGAPDSSLNRTGRQGDSRRPIWDVTFTEILCALLHATVVPQGVKGVVL